MSLPADIGGICFDMDGVLVHSEAFWVDEQRTHILPTAAPDDEIPVAAITGRNFREVYPDLAAEYDLAVSREEFEAMFEEAAVRIYGEQAPLLEGAHDLLSALADRGVPLALTTSAPRSWIDRVDERFDLTAHFDAVVSAEDLDAPGKPAPHIYRRGAAALGADPESCIAIEDSVAGVEAATAAGLYTVGFRGDGDETTLDGADEVVTGSEELAAFLLG
ncbi:HAD family hydrolase [Halorarius litoreus]|uniref:HAD family hydrolase n=1 Tax=Halorarius litoreus TaxID=2962676 RepID=UPI0020CEC979|nr:HAD family hydrolase [Halorarius litoreus]